MVMVRSAVKNNRRKSQREAARLQKQADAILAMEEEEEIHFKRPDTVPDTPRVSRTNSPDREEGEAKDYTAVLEMVKTVRDRLAALVLDNTNIRAACDDLRRQCHSQGVAFGDLSRLVKQLREDQEESRADTWEETRPHPRIQPAMSTPYQQSHGHPPGGTSTPGFPRPVCIEMSNTPAHHFAGPRQEGRPAHRPAAPIQRFNSKSIGWPAWFRHFRAVADVQGWDKDQRALQMVSYLDEKAMNVAQELSDRELYDYDALVGLLSARFDPASRVSASRLRFHGRTRRYQEDADTYADSITELCRLGYPQSSPELRQELISEQFVRGQSDPELKKDPNRSLYGFRQFESYNQCSPSGGAGVRVRGGGRPGGGDVRRGGPTAVEHTEGEGTTFVTGAATDVRSRASHGLRNATDRATLRRSSTDAESSIVPE